MRNIFLLDESFLTRILPVFKEKMMIPIAIGKRKKIQQIGLSYFYLFT